MIVYKIKNNAVSRVECEKCEYPLKDSEGDTIYENTHFLTPEEAYEEAIANCQAGVTLITEDIKDTREKLRKQGERLADECIDLERLKEEFQDLKGQ